MSFETVEQIIRYAVDKETEAAEFYAAAAEQEAYAAARETFLAFAEEEKKHKALFQELDRTAAAEFKSAEIPDLKRSDYMVDVEYRPGMSYPDILRLGMKREEQAKKFYDDCVSRVPDEDKKNLFRMLSQEEAKHKLKLETLYDDVMAAGGD